MTDIRRVAVRTLVFALICAIPTGGLAAAWRINCGGDAVTAAGGRSFRSDLDPRGRRSAALGGVAVQRDLVPTLAPVGDELLLRSWREDPKAYRFALPNGRYEVTLYVADFDSMVAGQRSFDVDLEREPWLRAFDPRAQAEMGEAIVVRALTQVRDGRLDIDFRGIVGLPIVSAIEVRPWRNAALTPTTPQLDVVASYEEALLSWSPAFERGIAGYVVESASQPEGPFAASTREPLRTLRWRDLSLAAGETRYYRVRALDLAGRSSSPSPVRAVTGLAWTQSALPLLRLDVLPSDLAQLSLDPMSDETVPALTAWGDAGWSNAKLRFRGFSARMLPKRAWRVKVQAPNGGDDVLIVNSNFADPSQIRSTVATDWFRDFGVAVPATEPIRLELNGHFAGVYQSVQRVDDSFVVDTGLAQRFALYKSYGNLTKQEALASYQFESGEPAADDLQALLAGLVNTPDADLPEWLSTHLDVDQMLAIYGLQIAIQNVDFTHKNFYLLHDRDRGQWRMIPWDLDLSFGPTKLLSTQLDATQPIDFGAQCPLGRCFPRDDGDSDLDDPVRGGAASKYVNGLFARMLQVPRLRRMHVRNLQRLIDSVMLPANANPLIESRYRQIADDRARDALRWRPAGARAAEAPERLTRWIAERRDFLQRELTRWAPSSAYDLTLDEVQADGAAAGWIELHNLGLEDHSLEGIVLTIGEAAQTLHGVSAPADGFVVLQRGVHFSAPLAATGGSASLTAPDGSLIARITWPALSEGQSFGAATAASFHHLVQEAPTAAGPNRPRLVGPPALIAAQLTPAYPRSQDAPQVMVYAERAAKVRIVFNSGAGWSSIPASEEPASPGYYSARMASQPDGTFVSWYARAESVHGAISTLPAGAPNDVRRYRVGDAAPTVMLNEFMASNRSTIHDEAGQYEDWAELYNPGEEPVDLSGYGLSDDATRPDKWIFPIGTTIPAHGFVLVWCDEEPLQGPLHASFKLDREGESLLLSQPVDGTRRVIDRIDFGLQQRDISWGRITDGAEDWSAQAIASPGAPNN